MSVHMNRHDALRLSPKRFGHAADRGFQPNLLPALRAGEIRFHPSMLALPVAGEPVPFSKFKPRFPWQVGGTGSLGQDMAGRDQRKPPSPPAYPPHNPPLCSAQARCGIRIDQGSRFAINPKALVSGLEKVRQAEIATFRMGFRTRVAPAGRSGMAGPPARRLCSKSGFLPSAPAPGKRQIIVFGASNLADPPTVLTPAAAAAKLSNLGGSHSANLGHKPGLKSSFSASAASIRASGPMLYFFVGG